MSDRVRGARPVDAFREGTDFSVYQSPYMGDLPYVVVGECLRCTHFCRNYRTTDERVARRSVLDHMWSSHRGYSVFQMHLDHTGDHRHLVLCNLGCQDFRKEADGYRDGVAIGEQHLRDDHSNN